MQDKEAWKPKSHTLRYPITLPDVGELSVIQLRAFSVGEHRAVLDRVGDDEDERLEALLALACGLADSAVAEIKRPDYVSLQMLLHEYITLPAFYFQEIKPADPDDVPLLVPVKGIGRTIERLSIDVPALKVTKAMRKLRTDYERADFCSASCTGLSVPELHRLSVPDWTQLQGRLNDFLNKPADFFQKTTLT